jgi:hypothetical protein
MFHPADDSKLYREIKSVEECQFLQDDLAKLEKWSTDSKMRFNTEKCKVLTISRKQDPTQFPYRIYGKELIISLSSRKRSWYARDQQFEIGPTHLKFIIAMPICRNIPHVLFVWRGNCASKYIAHAN